jgi:hypothetical protein
VSEQTKVIVVAILAWLADAVGFKGTRNWLLVWLGCKAVGELKSARVNSRTGNVAR